MTDRAEHDRRIRLIREAMARDGLEALIVSGSEYTGFEGAVSYLSGFEIVHRYAYVLLPLDEEPTVVFPSEARYVGEHATTRIDDVVFAEHPGAWLRDRVRERGWSRVGAYGLDYIMNVRDYRALADGGVELRGYDHEFDVARAVKSEAELESVRRSMAINEEGFWVLLEAYEPGKTEAAIMAPASARFVELGTARHAMNMVLSGTGGKAGPEFKAPSDTRAVAPDDLLLYSLEIAGWGGHWVEFSRPIIAGRPSDLTLQMMEAYEEYGAIAREVLKDGSTAAEVHHAVSAPFLERGFVLGHVTGHSIGMTMIEHPRIGAASDVVLRENMVLSLHPHAISTDGETCLYMQDTWRVGATAGEPLSDVPLGLFDGSERRVQA